MNVKQLREIADEQFSKRTSLLNFWQTSAENFYPQRADFTYARSLGTEFGAGLMTSYPVIAARDFMDQLGGMLRPKDKPWFHTVVSDTNLKDSESKRWLEWATETQRRAMYDRVSQFTRATKECDGDYSVFGQGVISVRLNRNADALLYRCWHLRDMAWKENAEGKIGCYFRKWKPAARDLVSLFPGKCHQKAVKLAEKKPFDEIECLHMIVESEMYDDHARGKPYYSVYYDCQNEHLIEAAPVFNQEYVIPRWQTVSGSQYSFSPAIVAALPDARLLQAMMHTLLEAGEKATYPPMIATVDAVRSDIDTRAGGITWIDLEYDERSGEALRTMPIDARGIPLGVEMYDRGQNMLSKGFYLDRLKSFHPGQDPQMTAFQAGQIVSENIRHLLPLFEPTETEYNAQVCEVTFDLLLRSGAFGSPFDMPKALQGAEIQFKFESPLHDAIEAQKGQKFLESVGMIKAAAEIDQTAPVVMNVQETLRDVLDGIGCPARWIRSEAEVAEIQTAESEAVRPEDIEQASKLLKDMSAGNKAAGELEATA